MISEYREMAAAVGMDETEAELWIACCRAEAHYRALREQDADKKIVDRARRIWNEAAWAYASYSGDKR